MRIPAHLAYAAVFVGVLGHASSEFVAVYSGVAGPEASVWRYVLGGLGLVVWAALAAGPRALLEPLVADGPAGAARFVALSLFGVSLAYLAFHWSLDHASVAQVATIVTTIPIAVALTNWAVNGEAPSRVKLATGALAFAGVALLIAEQAARGAPAGGAAAGADGRGEALLGIGLALICAVAAAYYSVLIKPVIARHGALPVTASSMMIGGVGLWIAVGAAWGAWVDPTTLFERPSREAWSLAALALWNTTVTQVLWLGGLAAAPDITRASYLFFLKPVLAAALAYFILSQGLSALQLAAVVLVAGSVLVEIFWDRILRALGRAGA